MKKSIIIIDWLLIIILVFIVVSRFINLPFTKVIKPIFLVLIFIHLIQHWKVIIYSFKGLRRFKK